MRIFCINPGRSRQVAALLVKCFLNNRRYQMRFLNPIKVLTVMGLVSGAVSAADAANLTAVQGQVQVSRAGGPFVATGATVVNPGDVVQALSGSSAQLVYADGAITQVASGSSVKVAADGAAVLSGASFQGAPGAGAAAAASTAPAVSATALVVGGVVAAAGVYAVTTSLAKKSSASP
jgi:hypothetical protein